MSNKSRGSWGIFLVCVTHSLCSMDDKKTEDLKQSGGNSTVSLSSSGSYSWTFNPLSMISGLVSSAANTVYNQTSQDAPFQKLGFPLTDSYASTELTKSVKLYKDILTTDDIDISKEYMWRVFRRTEYLTRIFSILSERPDFDDIILHCQKNHVPAMSVFLRDWYEKFLAQKLAVYNQLNEERKKLSLVQDEKEIVPRPQLNPACDAYSVQITVPTLAGLGESLWKNTNSLYVSAKNELSDAAAFQKLGWPLDDSKAQLELIDTLNRYDKVLSADTKDDSHIEAIAFVLRRTEYLVRAFLAIPFRGDGFEFSEHLLKYHYKAMFPVLVQKIIDFTRKKHEGVMLRKNEISSQPNSEIVENKIDFKFGMITNKNTEEIKKSTLVADCFLLKQKHETSGFVVTKENQNVEKLSQEGDFLVTSIPKIKLGILTADCLPIIFNDNKNNAVGIAHAGWRGSVSGISKSVLESMHKNYTTKPEDLSVIFGPCIHQCCYKVGQDLIARVKEHSFGEKTIITRENDQFFDMVAFNKALLINLGIKDAAIDATQSTCTSCNKEYHSHRREGELAGRQLSTVWIK